MYILEPIFDYRLWGGSRLTSDYGERALGLAHLYSVYSSGGISNKTSCGSTLDELFRAKKHEWGMERFDIFPLTIALVDAAQDLSIQVHPSDDRNSKNESWYFLEAPHSGYIYDGCIAKTKNELREALQASDPMHLIDATSIRTGDYIHIEPGTIHAITGGSLLYEIEYGSDITYRLYDYGRTDDSGKPRELHIEEGIAAVDLSLKSSPVCYVAGSQITEQFYFTALYDSIENYKNQHQGTVCITSLSDTPCNVDGIKVKKGMTILLEPGETLSTIIGKCTIAGLVEN